MLNSRKEILESWKRCLNYGIEKSIKKPELYEEKKIVIEKLKINNALIKIFNNQVNNLPNYYKSLLKECIFMLSDNKGMLLALYCDNKIKEELHRMGLMAGVYLTEKSCGTNAISLAIVTKDVAKLSKDEHYCSIFHDWYCIAGPLKVNDLIIGYLDISLIDSNYNKELTFLMNYLINTIILRYIEKTIFIRDDINLKDGLIEVLKLTAEGYSVKEASEILCISESTVKSRRAKLCELYKAKNIYQVIGTYLTNNIMDAIKIKIESFIFIE